MLSTGISDSSDATFLTADSSENATFAGNLTVSGNLTVTGTTTQVDTVTMNAQNAVLFEGATADAHETTLTTVDPTGDRTISLPNVSGTLPVLAAASATAITSTPAELNIMDGGTSATSITIADADRFVLNDNGTMLQVAASAVKSYIGSFDADASQVFNESGAAVDFRIESDDNANMFFVDGSEDKIGIGTSSPADYTYGDLVIDGTAGSTGISLVSTTSSYGGIFFADGTSGSEQYRGFLQYNHNYSGLTDMLLFGTGGATNMVLDSSGNLGIGTQSPDVKLEIAETASDTGVQLKLNGNRSSNGNVGDIIFENNSDSVAMIRSQRVGGNNDAADLSFWTQATGGSNSERMRIDSSGKVGINSTAPGPCYLTVKGTSDNQVQLDSNSSTANTGIFFMENGSNKGELYWRGSSNDFRYYNYNKNHEQWVMTETGKNEFYGAHQGDSVGHFVFSNDGLGDTGSTNCTLMVRNGNAQVQIMPWSTLGARIGTRGGGWNSNSNNAVHLTSNDAGNIILNTNGSPTLANGTAISSDERLKKNIIDIADGQLQKINLLKPRIFEWKDSRKTGIQEGFIAQEVESVMPEAVEERLCSPDPDDTSRDFEGDIKVLKHEVMNARLIKAVQELSQKVADQAGLIGALETRIETIEQRLI